MPHPAWIRQPARQSGYAGFECLHCGRDFRVPYNHNNRACCQRSSDEHCYLLEHSGERGVPRRVIDSYRDLQELHAMEPLDPPTKPMCTLSTGVEIEANLREIEHPAGRFIRGEKRFDIVCMDLRHDPGMKAPSRWGYLRDDQTYFWGDRSMTDGDQVPIGRLCWAAPGRTGIALPLLSSSCE